MHRKVNIIQYVKTSNGWRWQAIPKNRRTHSYLWAKAKSTHFYLTWREDGKQRYEKAGSTPSEALETRRRKEFELAGRAVMARGRPARRHTASFTIGDAVADYLDYIKNKKRPNTLKRYRAALSHFREFFRASRPINEVTPADIEAFRDERLREKNGRGKPITPANVNTEVNTIRAFYFYIKKFRDPSVSNPASGLKPLATTRRLVDVYDDEDLDAFFQACTLEEEAIFKTFAYTGLREQELAHLHWEDVNLKKKVLRVSAKPEAGFVPKGWEERELPLHPGLVELLSKLIRRHTHLVFPSFRGNPNGHLLRMLKRVAKRAGLPGRWYLHKFRKTFATRALQNGADIRTVQALLGHKDITTTARYLSTSDEKMRQAVQNL